MSSGLNLLRVIEEMRKFDNQIEAQAIAVFFFVATKAGKTNSGVAMQTISEELDLAQYSKILSRESKQKKEIKLFLM